MFPERISITPQGSWLHLNQDHERAGAGSRPGVRSGGSRALRRLALATIALLGLANTARPQSSLFDPRLDELRRASVIWDQRTGPARSVVDVVCLVPDV